MTINYEYHDVTASESLEQYAEEKLKMIFDHYDFVIRADVFFKTENTSSDDTGMKCGIRLSAPGPRLFAESSHENFHEAISDTVSELKRQLQKRKEKMKTH
ncbi:ribosome hibernation-promoting factor, HPF/YfiA family [Psychroserpens algicola]|uniref:Ribosome-associated translation inhibitor RaiA n=1 Tax=Psychroserpens algicola TaxID=1719034 RepID=A0ABT0HBV8_9FLAO|nr:ribosome-associated translation inhibitor RaiA [Psychroserpens algicola]MCK8481850.1 ribosome-associated translation inhibitor RaiA [Psychroserpens algicola]